MMDIHAWPNEEMSWQIERRDPQRSTPMSGMPCYSVPDEIAVRFIAAYDEYWAANEALSDAIEASQVTHR